MADSAIEVRPIAGAIGAEVHGLDLRRELSAATIAAIRRAWLEHCVIFFRDQPLAPGELLGFAKRFGEIVEYPFIKGIDGFPEIIPVVKLEHEKTNFGGVWHSDTSFLPQPPMARMPIAREVPGRRHSVCQYLPRLCDTVGGHEAPARGTDRRQQLAEGRCEPDPRGSRQRHAAAGCQQGIPRRASGGAHASGDGSQGALRQCRAYPAFQGYDRSGKRAAPRFSLPAADAAGVHLPLPLAGWLDRLLGQSLRPTQSSQRLPRLSPCHAANYAGRRHTPLRSGKP